MQEISIDFSDKINLIVKPSKWGDQKIDATQFSDELNSFLEAKAQKNFIKTDDLQTVFEVGFNSCANFFRAGKTEVQFAIARVNKFIASKDQSLKTHREFFDFSDMELGMAKIEAAKNKLTNKSIVAEDMMDEEEEDDDEGECECEEPEMDAKKTACAKCGKKMKAAKKS